MDLIYTNAAHEDVGVLKDYNFDLAFGSDENDFEVTIDSKNHCCESKCFLYIEGTEYGGIVDGLRVATKDNKLVYFGRTWHGVLDSKILQPDSGQDYLIVSGEANTVMAKLIDRIGLSDIFTASTRDSGLTISNYKIERYVSAYSGIIKMLATVSGKLNFMFKDGKVQISALPIVDYSQEEQFDNDQVAMEVKRTDNPINHLICLGKGELSERQVIHLFADAEGTISENQTFTGIDEVASVFNYSNVESLEELRKSGIEKLKSYISEDTAKMDFDAESTVYDIGDIVGAKEIITGCFVKEKIAKKIVTIKKGKTNIEYKVGG
jgi:hypothetical protein